MYNIEFRILLKKTSKHLIGHFTYVHIYVTSDSTELMTVPN